MHNQQENTRNIHNINKENNLQSLPNIDKCPYCKNKKIIRFGKVNDVQRYRCTDAKCKKTFTDNYFSPFKHSKKFEIMWERYYELMEKGLTIRECARILEINIITSFFWRHKILDSIKLDNQVDKLKEYVELTKFVHIESFKGSRKIEKTTRERINVISAIDNSNNILSEPISRQICMLQTVNKHISSNIDSKAYLVGYLDRILVVAAKNHNSKLKMNKGSDNIDLLDPHYSIKIWRWIRKFYGIATKYIDHYLNWHIAIYLNSQKDSYNINSFMRWSDIKRKVIEI